MEKDGTVVNIKFSGIDSFYVARKEGLETACSTPVSQNPSMVNTPVVCFGAFFYKKTNCKLNLHEEYPLVILRNWSNHCLNKKTISKKKKKSTTKTISF